MLYLKKYTSIITQTFLDTRSSIYVYYVRRCIYKANSPQDLTNIIKNIASNYKNISTDELFSVLTDCFLKYPLTDIELQKMSTWEQSYNVELGMTNYVTTIIWLSTIQAIQENEEKEKEKKNKDTNKNNNQNKDNKNKDNGNTINGLLLIK